MSSIEFNEIHLPKKLQCFTANLSSLAGTLRPTQEMVNFVSEQQARGEANPQPFAPYVIPSLTEHPWLPRSAPHINALSSWKAKNRGSRKQPIAFQMWLHHHYRFVFAAELCNAWAPFGGLAAQLNHIAVILSLATLENAAYAIRYHETLISALADYARARFPFDYHSALSEIHEETRRLLLRDTANNLAGFPSQNPIRPVPAFNLSFQRQKGKGRQKGNKGRTPGGKNRSNKGGKRQSSSDRPVGKGTAPPAIALPQTATGGNQS